LSNTPQFSTPRLNLLARRRDGHLVLNPDITDGLLALVDAIRALLACIEATGRDGDRDQPSWSPG